MIQYACEGYWIIPKLVPPVFAVPGAFSVGDKLSPIEK
jgi:hypothetical protein